jgi:membrane protein YdbS with pleckstrin-like domain/predicted RNA-binding Zn-ribbon protein involved in translation (DUF1610 family)
LTSPSDDATPTRIEWRCDACDRAFPVDPDADRVPCPYCGDINRIRRTVEAGVGAAPTAGEPDRSGTDDARRENVLRVVRPALVRGHPAASAGAIGLSVAGIVTGVLGLTGGGPDWLLWPGLAALGVGLVWSLWLFVLGHRWDRLRITNHRVIDERGIIMRSSSEVLHKHVRNIRITQTFWQRIVGIGDIEIDSAAGDGEADIRIANVPDPDGVKRLVDQHRGF